MNIQLKDLKAEEGISEEYCSVTVCTINHWLEEHKHQVLSQDEINNLLIFVKENSTCREEVCMNAVYYALKMRPEIEVLTEAETIKRMKEVIKKDVIRCGEGWRIVEKV